MKKALLLCALGAATALLAAGPAMADTTYSLSFEGCLGATGIFGACYGTPVSNGTTTGGTTDITFTVDGTPVPSTTFFPNSYSIESITGTVDIGGDDYTIGNLSSGLSNSSNDNILDDDFFGDLYFGGSGIDFLLSGSGSPDDYTELNLAYDTVQGEYTSTVEQCTYKRGVKTCTPETKTYTPSGLAFETISPDAPAPSPTPEPGSLALLGTAILGGAAALRRRFLA